MGDEQGRLGPIAQAGNQWVGYDDITMIRKKSQFIKDHGFGGGMIWALDLDDFSNRCGCENYPLLRTTNRVLRAYPTPPTLSAMDRRIFEDSQRRSKSWQVSRLLCLISVTRLRVSFQQSNWVVSSSSI